MFKYLSLLNVTVLPASVSNKNDPKIPPNQKPYHTVTLGYALVFEESHGGFPGIKSGDFKMQEERIEQRYLIKF